MSKFITLTRRNPLLNAHPVLVNKAHVVMVEPDQNKGALVHLRHKIEDAIFVNESYDEVVAALSGMWTPPGDQS
jgi:hypothetical protein